jgi:glucose-1-phosphate cytidylyltransferase
VEETILKAVILAGGRGTRLLEETYSKPKPIVEAHGKPLLWHILKNYSLHGINDFIILIGYKGSMIREYFDNFIRDNSDTTYDLGRDKVLRHEVRSESWIVTIIDSGLNTMTGGRLLKAKPYISGDFFLTYGDGVGTINVNEVYAKHVETDSIVTLTAVKPKARFGNLTLENNLVTNFIEKSSEESGWINGGFFAVSEKIFNYIESDKTSLEFDVLPRLANERNLSFHKHFGFWQPVDTMRDLESLNEAISDGKLPWMIDPILD